MAKKTVSVKVVLEEALKHTKQAHDLVTKVRSAVEAVHPDAESLDSIYDAIQDLSNAISSVGTSLRIERFRS